MTKKVGKNNHLAQAEEQTNQLSHYSLRKLSVGVASVLIGIYFAGFGLTQSAKASTDSTDNPAVTQQGSQQSATTDQMVTLQSQPTGSSTVTEQPTNGSQSGTKTSGGTPSNNGPATVTSGPSVQPRSLPGDPPAAAVDTSAWTYGVNTTGATIEAYHGTDTNAVIPNTQDLIAAGIIHDGQIAMIDPATMHHLVHQAGINSLSISHTGNGTVKAMGNDWRYAFAHSTGVVNGDPYNDHSNRADPYSTLIPYSVGKLDLRGLDTSGITNMTGMFYAAPITDLNVDGWDVSNVTTMHDMFYQSSLSNLDLSSWHPTKTSDFSAMFNSMGSLVNLKVDHLVTNAVTDLSGMFGYDSQLQNCDVSQWDTSNVTEMGSTFSGTINLDPAVENWNTSHVTDMNSMFDYSGIGGTNGNADLSHWDTSNVTTMDDMFSMARKLVHLNATGWNTSKVTTMGYMFRAIVDPPDSDGYISRLQSVEGIGGWDTSNVTVMARMFEDCIALTDQGIAGIENWNTSKLANLNYAFRNTRSLTHLDLSHWNTQSLQGMGRAFAGSGVTYLNLSNWHFPPSSGDPSEDTRAIFEHLGQGQPVLIELNNIQPAGGYLNLNTINHNTGGIDFDDSDLPTGPTVIIANDGNGNLALHLDNQPITDDNNQWDQNIIENQDGSDFPPQYANQPFAFASVSDAKQALKRILSDHGLKYFTGHSTYYDTADHKAYEYDPTWNDEGPDGTWEKMTVPTTQPEITASPFKVNDENINNLQATELPLVFSGIYNEETAVTVEYVNSDTGNVVHSDPPITGNVGSTITLTYHIPAGYHLTPGHSLPSTSFTFTASDQTIQVPVTKDPVQDVTVTVNFKDQETGTIVKHESYSGQPDSTRALDLTIPSGYHLVAGQTLPNSPYTFLGRDQTFTILIARDSVPVENVTVTVHFVDQDTGSIVKQEAYSGAPASVVTLDLTIPSGYHLVAGEVLPNAVYTFSNADDLIIIYINKDQTTQPTEPTQPTQPTKPTQPTAPTQPTKPTQPTTPTHPTQPTEVTEPSQPTSPSSPTSPTSPNTPVTPVQPTAPQQPTVPGQEPLQPQGQSFEGQTPKPIGKQLPQTGNQKNAAGVLGLLGMIFAGLLGFVGKKREE